MAIWQKQMSHAFNKDKTNNHKIEKKISSLKKQFTGDTKNKKYS